MRRAVILVPAAHKESADGLAVSFAKTPPAAPDFGVPLTSDGVTITHYACCPDPGPELTVALESLKGQFAGSDYLLTDDWTVAAGEKWLATKGLSVYVPPDEKAKDAPK